MDGWTTEACLSFKVTTEPFAQAIQNSSGRNIYICNMQLLLTIIAHKIQVKSLKFKTEIL